MGAKFPNPGAGVGHVVIQRVPITRINPAPYNPRKDLQPGDPGYERLRGSLEEFGYVDPLVWNKRTGHLVGGHQRLKVLIASGATEVDVSVVELPPDREKVLNLRLNRPDGEWEQTALASLLDEVRQMPDIDLTLTGFDAEQVEKIVQEGHRLIEALVPPADPEPPEDEAEDKGKAGFGVMVVCKNRAQQRRVYDRNAAAAEAGEEVKLVAV